MLASADCATEKARLGVPAGLIFWCAVMSVSSEESSLMGQLEGCRDGMKFEEMVRLCQTCRLRVVEQSRNIDGLGSMVAVAQVGGIGATKD